MGELAEILRDFCLKLGAIFFRSYGQPSNSSGKDADLPIDPQGKWVAVANISVPSVVTITNTHAANELMFSWNSDNPIGGRVPAGAGRVYDDHKGQLYAKASDPTKASSINILVTGLWTD